MGMAIAASLHWMGVLLVWNIRAAAVLLGPTPDGRRYGWPGVHPTPDPPPQSNQHQPTMMMPYDDQGLSSAEKLAIHRDCGLGLRCSRRSFSQRKRQELEHEELMQDAISELVSDVSFNRTHGLSRLKKSTDSGQTRRRSNDQQQRTDLRYGFSFLSLTSYATVRLQLASTYSVSFQMKTAQQTGLLLFASGEQTAQFFAVELVDGQVQYSYDVGLGPKVVRVNLANPVNDNRWHFVEIIQPSVFEHILHVDNSSKADVSHDSRTVYANLGDTMYFGGISEPMFAALPKQVKSRTGILGCLASVTVRSEIPSGSDELMAEIPVQFMDEVEEGCRVGEMKERCNEDSCANGGICHQGSHSFYCSCNMTSFVGRHCDEDGVTYKFGTSGGLIVFTFDDKEKTNTRQDSIAFGFITSQPDAVLLRIASDTSSDYIEVELIDGNMFVVYNVGTADHPIGEPFNKVNDNNYHVLRFHRYGANSTLQLDDFPVQTKFPSGRQVSAFNSMEKIFVGGHRNAMGQLIKPFHGTISGLFVNGHRVLELASAGDERVAIVGEVELAGKLFLPSSYIRTSPHTVVVRLRSYDRTSVATDSNEVSSAVSCSDNINQQRCRNIKNHPISPSLLSSNTPPRLKGGKHTTRHPPTFESDAEHRRNRNGSASSETQCRYNQNGCANTGTSPSNHSKADLPVNGGTSIYNISLDSQKSELGTRTHPMFLSHLEPASNPTNTVTSVTDSSRQVNSNTKIELSKKQDALTTRTSSTLHVGLAAGLSVGAMLLLIAVAYAIYKYRSRDEGTYRIDEGNGYDAYNSKPLIHLNGRAKYSRQKTKDNKEWYV